MILGCDLSTSISGYTVIDDEGKIVFNESVDTRRIKEIEKVAEENRKLLNTIKEKYDIRRVFVEESLQSFRSGFSSAHTISILSKINGIICYIIYKEFGITAEHLAARSARKDVGVDMSKKNKKKTLDKLMECGIKKKTAKSKVTKTIVHDFIRLNEDSFEYDETYAGNPKPESYDRADSIVIARAGEQKIKQEE